MEANKCPNCGASINNMSDSITTCTYCGGTIINKAVNTEQPEPPTRQESSSYTTIRPEHPGSVLKLKFRPSVFIVLLICMWPLAFIYSFLCKDQNKNKK